MVQLPDSPNILLLLRIDMCIITILETMTNSALLLQSMHTETETFDFPDSIPTLVQRCTLQWPMDGITTLDQCSFDRWRMVG